MKQFTHAWLAFMAINRLSKTKMNYESRRYADELIKWFKNHRDGVIQGSWYPDFVIKDMANSHVLKLTPSIEADNEFKYLPTNYLNYEYGKKNPLKKESFTIEKGDNLPDRCESIAHSVIDHLKIQKSENKGSPVSPTDNQVALLLFMLSHYIADAHVPVHCDSRKFSDGANIHGCMEGEWENMILKHYEIDKDNNRFFYDQDGYPLRDLAFDQEYQQSYLKKADDELNNRKFVISWGRQNNNTWDFMSAICQYSYLLSYYFIPKQYNHKNITSDGWKSLGSLSFEDFSVAVISDAIDSIARVWFRVWRRYVKWEKGR